MSAHSSIPLNEIMPPRLGSVDPSSFPSEEFDLYSIPAFDRGQPEVLKGRQIGSAKQIVRPGDVLLSRIVPHIRRAWVVGADRGRRIIASGEWIVFRGESVEPKYLRHVLVSDPFHVEFMRTVSGVGGSLLRARPAYVEKIRIPLPPLPEQRRIAAILDKADALRTKRRAALAQLETLTESIFLDMFGDPVSNPKGWPETLLLGDVAEIVSGVTIGRRLNGQSTRSVPYLAVSNVHDRSLALGRVKVTAATEGEINRYRLVESDLVLTEGGDPDKLGRGALWRNELRECIHQNHVFRVRITHSAVTPVFLSWLVGSQRGKRYFLKSAKQTTGIASINMTQLRGFPLLSPPVDFQREFADREAAVQRHIDRGRGSLAQLDVLFASLQQRAFRGEL